MTNRKRPLEIWPFEKAKSAQGNPVAVFYMPDGSDLYVRYDTPEELTAAQYKARATAKAIVRSESPLAFKGLPA